MSENSADPITGRFTEWFRNRPTSLEFWELVVGENSLGCCFAGESFSSLLLRADMGESTRSDLNDCSTIEECVALDDRNFTIPLSSLTTLRLREGTRTRRTQLRIAWSENGNGEGDETSWTLSNTARGEPQTDLVRALADRDAPADAEVGIDSRRLAFL
ncbi:hypothetical protein [Halococcus sp. AFM35]|uniref:hypothetical protein n=1 Tax=Halococcus sp. AFM35 TaxID=3421653 RepID=UPI003EB87F1A